jgi:hypothetical protein
VQYAGEERIRIAVVIDGVAPAREMAATIGPACGEIIAMDILFLAGMPARDVAHFEDLPPFYESAGR